MTDLYKELSEERKRMQKDGNMPNWYTTSGWQLFKSKYLYNATTPKEQYGRIADTLAKHTPNFEYYRGVFFDMLWSGVLSPSTPVLSNTGTDRGMPVSCSGNVIQDSVDSFYSSLREQAILTKNGFGTSSDLSKIRQRGSSVSTGTKASGVLPVVKMHSQAMADVTQGQSRRGAWAGYLDIEHGDFWELAEHLQNHPDGLNIGWTVKDSFIRRLKEGDEESNKRFSKVMKVKLLTGKGYFFFVDKVNRANPANYPGNVLASNLCTEITLRADEESTFTCVLSSLNLTKINTEDLEKHAFHATLFLECVAKEFLAKAKGVPGLEKAVKFTESDMALGLGVCGFHTALQQRMIPFESLEASYFNKFTFESIQKGAEKAKELFGMKSTHLTAIAPTASTALIMGGVSQGIEPSIGNAFVQASAGGEMVRVNPVFLDLLKEKGEYNDAVIKSVLDNEGSVQHLTFLSDLEKLVFRTAYEIDQDVIIRLAAQRQKHIDQAQSINLFFSAEEDERRIVEVHKKAFVNENIKSLYYVRTQAGVPASTGECVACQ